jgi:hypothetical protein
VTVMGEAKRRNQKREAIIAAEPRCIYCPGPVETLEHMPPMGMLRGHQRPGGMEYAAAVSATEEHVGPMSSPP